MTGELREAKGCMPLPVYSWSPKLQFFYQNENKLIRLACQKDHQSVKLNAMSHERINLMSGIFLSIVGSPESHIYFFLF